MLPFTPTDLGSIQPAFRGAPAPHPAQLAGLHEATFLGPWHLRTTAPLFMAATGMPGWWGKAFDAPDGDDRLAGANVLLRKGVRRNVVPMTAGLETSPVDGLTDMVVRYPPSAPWPWRSVADHLRPVGEGLLLGLTFGLPMTPTSGAPFLLTKRRESGI